MEGKENLEAFIYNNARKLSALIDYEVIGEIGVHEYKDDYLTFNSSLYRINGKMMCAYRSASFNKDGLVDDLSTDKGGESLLHYGEFLDGKVVNSKLISPEKIKPRTAYEITGLEDPRLFEWKGKPYASCSYPTGNMGVQKIEMVLVDIEEEKVHFLSDPFGRQYVKNWIPYVKNDELFFITDVNPIRIFKYEDLQLKPVGDGDLRVPADIHGGTVIMDYNGKNITLVHGRFYWGRKIFYWHAFAEITEEYELKLGNIFYFEECYIEFSSCAILDNGSVIVTYSVLDEGSKIIKFDQKDLEKLL